MTTLLINDEHFLLSLKDMQITIKPEAAERLIHFANLILKWNRIYNLISVNDTKHILNRHILDSLALLKYLQGTHILDVGTGAGLPGVPLAIIASHQEFTLLDSNAKRIHFLQQVKIELGLHNITPIHMRSEDFQPPIKFDTIATRAFATISEMLAKTRHLCAETGCFLAMKGKYPEQEIASIPDEFRVDDVYALELPTLTGSRHIVKIMKR